MGDLNPANAYNAPMKFSSRCVPLVLTGLLPGQWLAGVLPFSCDRLFIERHQQAESTRQASVSHAR